MKDKIKILSTISIYHAFNDGSVVLIPILFPVLKDLFDLTYTQVGIITSAGFLMTLITQLLVGRISDKKNRSNLLSFGILLLCGSLVILVNAYSFLSLLIIIILLRFSTGFYHPIGISWISKIFKKERLDWAMGMQSAAGNFGAFISIFTTLYIVEKTNWTFPLYIWAAAGVICLLFGIFLTKNLDPKYTIQQNNKKKELKKSIMEDKNQLKKVSMFLPGIVISAAAWGVVITYLPLFLDERTTLSLTFIGLLVSIWIGIGTIICLFYNKIQERFGRKNVVLFSYLTIGLMGICLSFFTDTFILIAIMFLLGVSTFLSYPALFSFISELTDEKKEGTTFAYIFTVHMAGGTFLIFLGGITADLYGIWSPFFLLGISGLIVTFILFYSFYKLRKSS